MTTTGGLSEIDAPEGLVLTTFDVDRHAQAAADMWNASDANWPGTWTGGVPETAEKVKRDYALQETIETFVSMDGDVMAGFCKVMPDLDEAGVDYVALVNVPPSHQKRGVARRLLQRATALAVERGSYRLDLHTWSANLNAVPLYKKVGFMWLPDTDIHMLNFIPAILRLDAAKEFFATRNWYEVFRRPLDQVPDEDRWQDMKVFTYRFADSASDGADAEPALVVRVDREARAICAVETPAYAVAATAARLDPPRGGEVTLRWTITNRGTAPLPVTVVASGNQELLIDYRGSAEVAPGATEVLEGSCRIPADAKDVKYGKPVPAVKSVLLMGEQVVELSTGLRPRPALEIRTWPAHITVAPGERRKVHVRLRNRLPQDVKVDLRATPGDGLELDWTSRELTAAGEGWCGAELEVFAPAGSSHAYPLALSATCSTADSTLRVDPDPRHVFAVAPGGLAYAKGKDALRIENDHMRAFVTERGGVLQVADPGTGGGRAASVATPGPPFQPSEFRSLDYDLEFRPCDGGVEALAMTRSKRWAGFVFRRRIRFTSGPIVELGAEVENGGVDPRRVQVNQLVWTGEGVERVVPLSTGLRAGPAWADFPGSQDEASKKPEAWAENWSANEARDGTVTGMVWPDTVEEVWYLGAGILTKAEELAPQSILSVEPALMYSGPGRWQALRDLWRRRAGVSVPRDTPPETPEQSLSVRVDPAPWIAGEGTSPVRLTIEHGATWPVEGTATLVAPEGWSLSKSEVDLADTTWQKPAGFELEATPPPGAAAAGQVRIEVRAKEFDRDLAVPVVAFADAPGPAVSSITEDGRELWRIDAGRSQVTVAPAHAGATISWKVDGTEQLAASYPESGSIGWLLPWHGGITPIMMMGEVNFPGRMWAETFDTEEIEEKDGRGLLWRGVKVVAESTHDESKGMRLEALTLAHAGAPVLKSVVRLTNTTGSLQTPTFGSMIFCAPGGDRSESRLVTEGLVAKPSPRYVFETKATWGAAVNSATGATVLVTTTRELQAAKFGEDGAHILNLRSPEVEAGQTVESVCYVVAAESLEAAEPWRALAHLT